MMIFYNIGIWLYLILIYVSSLFRQKSKQWIIGRKNIFKKIQHQVQGSHDIVWFHCASLGEFEQAEPVMRNYKFTNPKHKIILTFFSPSGYEVKKNSSIVDWVSYLPIDTKKNAKKFVKIVNPIKVIFIKNEFWLNYMNEIAFKNIPLYHISTIFRQKQIFFKSKKFAEQLKNVTHFFVQDQKSKALLKKIGFINCLVSGDTRFDKVFKSSLKRKNNSLVELFSKNKKTIIVGSSWPKDEKIITKYIQNYPHNNYIIAPHEMNNISSLQIKTRALLYSNANNENICKNNVLIIDNIGLLSSIYQYASIAYIGGGFGAGIHNILEATTFGLPVIFGPKYQKANEAISLIRKKAAISITNYDELVIAIDNFKDFKKSIALEYIKENIGATKKILSYISKQN